MKFQSAVQTSESKAVRDVFEQLLDKFGQNLTPRKVIDSLLSPNEQVAILDSGVDLEAIENNTVGVVVRKLLDSSGEDLTLKLVMDTVLFGEEQNAFQIIDLDEWPAGSDCVEVSHSGIPTSDIPTSEIYNSNHDFDDLPVLDANNTNLRPESFCAVGSNITTVPKEGETMDDFIHYWCNFCRFKTWKKDELLDHVACHRFHCKRCSFQAFSRAAVVQHCVNDHPAFHSTAQVLKYCIYIPNMDKKNDKRKRKGSDLSEFTSSEKRVKLDCTKKQQTRVENTNNNTAGTLTHVKFNPDIRCNTATQTEEQSIKRESEIETSEEAILPIISSIMSGQEAVLAAIENSETERQTPQKIQTQTEHVETKRAEHVETKKAEHVETKMAKPSNEEPASSSSEGNSQQGGVISSSLYWKCGYCKFLTLFQINVKTHHSNKHHGKAPKYVAMLASSQKQLEKIRLSDENRAKKTAPSSSTGTDPGPKNRRSSPRKAKHAGGDKQTDKGDDANSEKTNDVDENEIPDSFKCNHCNFSETDLKKVKSHLHQRHCATVMYALDMKAVKLMKKRYIFMCMKLHCPFHTKDEEEYYEHVETCTPWLNQDVKADIDPGLVKSLQLTLDFIEKFVKSVEYEGVSPDVTQYGCMYCNYVTARNTGIKKHTLTTHPNKQFVVKDLKASKVKKKVELYFCKHCFWETHIKIGLAKHIKNEHKIK